MTNATAGADAISPFLDDEPPIWAARGLAYILLALGSGASVVLLASERAP